MGRDFVVRILFDALKQKNSRKSSKAVPDLCIVSRLEKLGYNVCYLQKPVAHYCDPSYPSLSLLANGGDFHV